MVRNHYFCCKKICGASKNPMILRGPPPPSPGGLQLAAPGELSSLQRNRVRWFQWGPTTLKPGNGLGKTLSMEKSKLWKGRPTWRSKRKMLGKPNAFDSDHRCSKVGTSIFQKVFWAFRVEFPRNPTGTKWVIPNDTLKQSTPKMGPTWFQRS